MPQNQPVTVNTVGISPGGEQSSVLAQGTTLENGTPVNQVIADKPDVQMATAEGTVQQTATVPDATDAAAPAQVAPTTIQSSAPVD